MRRKEPKLQKITVVQRDDLAGQNCNLCRMCAHPLYQLHLQFEDHGGYAMSGCATCINSVAKGVQLGWPRLPIHTSRVFEDGRDTRDMVAEMRAKSEV